MQFLSKYTLCFENYKNILQKFPKNVNLKDNNCFVLELYPISSTFFFFFFFLCLQHMEVTGLGSNQRCSWGLCHSHGNTRSEQHLWSMPQLAATLDPYPLSHNGNSDYMLFLSDNFLMYSLQFILSFKKLHLLSMP